MPWCRQVGRHLHPMGRLPGYKTGKKIRLPASNPGTSFGFSLKYPSIEQKSPFHFPVRHRLGAEDFRKQLRTRPEATDGTGAVSLSGRRKAVLAPLLSGGIPKGGRPPSGASLVTFCAYRKSPQRSVPGVWGWNSQATAGRRIRPEIFCEFRIKLWRKLENCAIVMTGRSPGFPKLRPQTGRKELST